MISERICDDIPPQMKILVIPILMHFCSFVSNFSDASRTQIEQNHYEMDLAEERSIEAVLLCSVNFGCLLLSLELSFTLGIICNFACFSLFY